MPKTTKLVTTLATFIASTIAMPVFAADSPDTICGNPNISAEIKRANGCPGANNTDLTTTIVGILNGIIAVLGLLAVIFVLIGGINYMTSAGDPSKTKKAKDTIIYALIGLVICVLAFALVNFVIVHIIAGE